MLKFRLTHYPTSVELQRSTDGGITYSPIPGLSLGTHDATHPDSGLTANSHYFYQVGVTQPDGLEYFSNSIGAWTYPAAPTNVTAPAVSDTGALLTWQAPAGGSPPTHYKILRNGALIGTPVGTAFQDQGLTPGTTYPYSVIAVGPTDEESAAATHDVTTADLIESNAPPPAMPASLTSVSTDGHTVTLTWTSVDGLSYEIIRDGELIGTATSLDDGTYTDTSDLTPSTTYDYSVIAVDGNNNASAAATTSVTTATEDNSPPSAPTNLIVTANTGTQISISWSPASDDVAVTAYKLICTETAPGGSATNISPDNPTDGLEFSQGTTPGYAYSFTVYAMDAEGNQSSESASSGSVVATTAQPVVDVATHQYIPQVWQDYFYNALTPALRGMKNLVGSIPNAARWLDNNSLIGDTVILDNHVVSQVPAPNNVYYHDANQNGQYDDDESVWIGISTSNTYNGQPLIGPNDAGKTLPNGTLGTTGLLLADPSGTIINDGSADDNTDKLIFVDPNEIKGVQGELAYHDANGDGQWDSGEPIWNDANHNNKYDTGETGIYEQDTLVHGEWGKKNGLNFYDFSSDHSGTWSGSDNLIWIDHSIPPDDPTAEHPTTPAIFQWDMAGMYRALENVNQLVDVDTHKNLVYNSLGDFLSQLGGTTGTLTGTISGGTDTFTRHVTGNGTHFMSEIQPGDFLEVDGKWYAVESQPTSDTELDVDLEASHATNLPAFSNVTAHVINWTRVPHAEGFNEQRGLVDGKSLIFPQQFQQLHDVLSALQQPPPAFYDLGKFTAGSSSDGTGSDAFLTVATKVIKDYDAVFGPTDDSLEREIKAGDLDPGNVYKWDYISQLQSMVARIAGHILARGSVNGWDVGSSYDSSIPAEFQTAVSPVTLWDEWSHETPAFAWTTTDVNGNTLGMYSPIEPDYLSQISTRIGKIDDNGLWIFVGHGTQTADSGQYLDPHDFRIIYSGPYVGPVYGDTLNPTSPPWTDLGSEGAEINGSERTPNDAMPSLGEELIEEVIYSGMGDIATLPDASNSNGGTAPTTLAAGPESAGLDTSGWTWGSNATLMDYSSAQMLQLLQDHYPPNFGTSFVNGQEIEETSYIAWGVKWTWKAVWANSYLNLTDTVYADHAESDAAEASYLFDTFFEFATPAPSIFGLVPASNFSYTPGDEPGPPSIAPPPDDLIPLTSKMEFENRVQDTNLDDIVQIDHDQNTFGSDTGSMSFEPQRDLPQVYLPLNTDGLDDATTSLPVHEYLVQGGFGTQPDQIGDLGTDAWTFADANENGQPYAYSLDTRVDIDYVINDDTNHFKRIEVIRPEGNAVVFDFAWDPDKQSFSAMGFPTGMDLARLYVLRALQPQNDNSLQYELLFPSGIIQTFNGPIVSVKDASSGLEQSVGGGLSYGDGTGDPSIPDSSRYTMSLNWADGTIASVDYTTKPDDLGTSAAAKTIETNLKYEDSDDENRITALEKTDGTGESATAIPEFSFASPDITHINGNGYAISRAGTVADGSVTITTTITGVSGHTSDLYELNADNLIVADTHTLVEPDGTSTSALTTYTYQERPNPDIVDTKMDNRYADNGAAQWGKVSEIDYPDGSWETFDYGVGGWLLHDTTPFKNGAVGGSNNRVTLYDYSNKLPGTYDPGTNIGGMGDQADPIMLVAPPRKTVTSVQGTTTGITLAAYHSIGGMTIETRNLAGITAGNDWAHSKFVTSTTLTGYNSYSVKQGAQQLDYAASDTGVTSTAKWKNTTLSSLTQNVNSFGGLKALSSSGLGQTPEATTSTPTVDSVGRILSATTTGDLQNTVQSYGWFGPLTATGADHVQTTYTYTDLGQIETAVALGVTITYSYDAAGNIVSVQTDGAVTNNGSGNPALSTTVSYTWDAQGRMTSSTDALLKKTTYAYDDGAHTVTTTYSDSTTEVDSYYLDGASKSIGGSAATPSNYDEGVDSNGDQWTGSSIDGGSHLAKSYTNTLGENYKQTTPTPDGGTATATTLFDSVGRPYQTTDLDGSVVTTGYDPNNGLANKTTQLSNNGPSRVTIYGYFNNDDGYSGETITSGDSSTSYGQGNGGLTSREIDNGLTTTTDTEIGTGIGEAAVTTTLPDGTKIKDNYSNDLLQSEQQLGTNGSVVTSQLFGYDALGQNTSSTDPVFGKTSWTLRLDGSVSGTTMPGHSASVVNTTDPATQIPTASTRSDGGTQSQSVNALGQITSQSGAGLIASQFGYDGATGQLNDLKLYTSGTVGTGTAQETKWGYDGATGNLVSQTMADDVNGSDKINYNYTGVQLHTITGEGKTTTLGYNSAGEQTNTVNNDGATTVLSKVESQDAQGRPISIVGTQTENGSGAVDSSATNAFQYSNGNITDESQAAGVTVHYDYYGTSEIGSGASPGALKDIQLVQGGNVRTTTFQYNATTGRLQNIIANGVTFSVGYLSNSNAVHTITAVGASTTWNYYTSGGSDGNLSSVTVAAGDSTPYSGTYTYNDNDQMATATVAQATDSSAINYTQTYDYNNQDGLTSVEGSGDSNSYGYTYDGVGNRTNAFGTVNSLNEYSNFAYNQRGDITDDGIYVYTWNSADQLTAVTAKDGSVKVAYQYDGQGRRIEKDVYYGEAGTWTLSSTRKFIYDGTNLVEELDGNGAPITGYAWGPQGLLAVTDFTTTAPTVYMPVVDGQGNVVGLVNTANDQVAASYTYDPYGALLSATGPAAGVCNIRYKQSYCDAEVKMNHEEDRDETWKGFWDKPDPTGIANGFNKFVYCDDDPINMMDPTGDAPTSAEIAAGNAAMAQAQKVEWLKETYGPGGWNITETQAGFMLTQPGSGRGMTFDTELNQTSYVSADRGWRIAPQPDGSVVQVNYDPRTGNETSRRTLVESDEVRKYLSDPNLAAGMQYELADKQRLAGVMAVSKGITETLDTLVRLGSGPAGMIMIDLPEAVTGQNMTRPGQTVGDGTRILEGASVGFFLVGKAKRIAVLVENAEKGSVFERAVVREIPDATGVKRMIEIPIIYQGQKLIGRSIPDVMIARAAGKQAVMIEVKNYSVRSVKLGKQLITQLAWANKSGYKYRLIVSQTTRVADDAYQAITNFGGTIEVFDPITRTFTKYVKP